MGNKSRGGFPIYEKRGHPELVSGSTFWVFVVVVSLFIVRGCFCFFFFVKMQTLSIGCTRMCALYKNVYKRPFCSNIKKSKKEEV